MATFASSIRTFPVVDGPPRGYGAFFWFLEMVAFSFVLVSVERLFSREYRTSAYALVGGIVIAIIGLQLPRIKEAIRSLMWRSPAVYLEVTSGSTASIAVKNTGGPFVLVTRAKIISAVSTWQISYGAVYNFEPRQVMGGDDSSTYTVATVGASAAGSFVEVRGEQMRTMQAWHVRDAGWFEVEWTFQSLTNGHLKTLRTVVTHVTLDPTQHRLNIETDHVAAVVTRERTLADGVHHASGPQANPASGVSFTAGQWEAPYADRLFDKDSPPRTWIALDVGAPRFVDNISFVLGSTLLEAIMSLPKTRQVIVPSIVVTCKADVVSLTVKLIGVTQGRELIGNVCTENALPMVTMDYPMKLQYGETAHGTLVFDLEWPTTTNTETRVESWLLEVTNHMSEQPQVARVPAPGVWPAVSRSA